MLFLLVILLYTYVIVNIVVGKVENSQQIHIGEYGTYSLNLKRYNENLPLRQGPKLDKNYSGQPEPPSRPESPLKPSLLPSSLSQHPNLLAINLPSVYNSKNYDIKGFLRRSRYSRKIYCRVLLQINYLKKDHKALPLKENFYLDILAQDLANKWQKKRNRIFSQIIIVFDSRLSNVLSSSINISSTLV
uniref:Uncharacterized protein n=1 Tax=Strongyloides venezuelensis TaxID=75913 RepID=A0A0K0G1Z6_STRVS